MVRMSRTSGTFVSTTGASVRSTAHSSGSEAFFAPEMRTVPSSGRPPTRRILSIVESLSPGERGSRRAVTTRGIACRSGDRGADPQPGALEDGAHRLRLARADLDGQPAARPQRLRRGRGQPSVDGQRVAGGEEGDRRLVVADLGGERVAIAGVDVRRVADDEVEAAGLGRDGLEQVALVERDAALEPEPPGVLARDRERGRRDVGRADDGVARAPRRATERCSRSRFRRRRSPDGPLRAAGRARSRRGSRSPAAARARRA